MISSVLFRLLATMTLAVMIGCDGGGRNGGPEASSGSVDGSAAAPADAPPTVLMLGTSLTAGLGLQPEDAYPALVQERIDSAGLPFRVVNAGVSGETSAGALRRLDWLMRQRFDVLLLETGANDMLRGMDLDSTRANIQAIVDRVRADRPGVPIVLAGMLAPPNLGREYGREFRELYSEVAAANHLPLIPFLLEDVGGVAEMNQADGIHPNEEGAAVVAANVWEVLEPVLREAAGRAGAGAVLTPSPLD
jgi:acyl-CoA thioesterase I